MNACKKSNLPQTSSRRLKGDHGQYTDCRNLCNETENSGVAMFKEKHK